MNSSRNIRRIGYVLLVGIIILLSVVGLQRRGRYHSSTLADDFRRPGGDTLSVAIEMSPLTYTLRNDSASGFDYEVLTHLCRSHGLVLRLRPVSDLDRAFQGLYDGDYDLLVASMPGTSALKEYFPLTRALYLDRQVLVQRRDSTGSLPVEQMRQLRDDTVWIAHGSPFKTRLRNLAAELGDTICIVDMPGYSQEALARMTALGELRHAVVNEAVARSVAADYPSLDISTPVSLSQLQCWAVAPGDTLLRDSLDTWLDQFRATAAYDSIAAAYGLTTLN